MFNILIETLAEARFKAKRAELTSDLSDDDNRKKKLPVSAKCPVFLGIYGELSIFFFFL